MKLRKILCPLVLSIGVIGAQSCRSMDKPGSSGNVPPVPNETTEDDENANAVINLTIIQAIPREPACGATYVFTAEATEIQVGCKDYHYRLLYREALRHAEERTAEILCWDPCPDPHQFIVMQEGSCVNNRAKVTLSMAVKCIRPNETPENGLPIMVDEELRAPFHQGPLNPQVPSPETLAIDLRPNQLAGACPFDFKYWITMKQFFFCNQVADYSPFVARAKQQAEKIWEATRCANECPKRRLREIGTSWTCEQNEVVVRHVFQVPCGF